MLIPRKINIARMFFFILTVRTCPEKNDAREVKPKFLK